MTAKQSDFRRQQYVDACALKAQVEAEAFFDDQFGAPNRAPVAVTAPAPPAERKPDDVVTLKEFAELVKLRPETLRKKLNAGNAPRVGDKPLTYAYKTVREFQSGMWGNNRKHQG